MTDRLLVGIDVGTSHCKAVVLGADGSERAIGRRPTPWQRHDGRSELAAETLIDAVLGACADALDDVPGEVAGIGVTSMAEAGFLHDASGAALAPTVGWHDAHAREDELAALRRDLPSFTEVTGLWVRPRTTLLTHRSRVRQDRRLADAAGWSNVAEHVVVGLGGERVTEPSLASRTGWFDVERMTWWSEALSWSGCAETMLPEMRPAGASAGRARGVARLDGAVLTVAGHDHLCGAVGAGALSADEVVDSCGSAEVLLRSVSPAMSPEVRVRAATLGFTSGRHVLPDRLALIGGFRSGALLGELADALGVGAPDAADRLADSTRIPTPVLDLEEVEQLVAALRRGGTPPDDASAAILWRHGVDAVAARAARMLGDLTTLTGPLGRLLAVGGSADRGLVAEARRRHLGPAQLPAVREAAGRGAALFGGVAAGLYEDPTAFPEPPVSDAGGRGATTAGPAGRGTPAMGVLA